MSAPADAPRVEAPAKVTGRARYAADVSLPMLTHGVLVGSRVASGRITAIDTWAAEHAPGVLLVLTHRNRGPLGSIPSGTDHATLPAEARPPLEDDRIRYHGQYVALVVAETFEQARFAASLVDVAYQATQPIISLDDARAERAAPEMAQGEPLRRRRGKMPKQVALNAVQRARCGGSHGDYAGGVADAEVFVERAYTTPNEHPTAMEPHAAVAAWNDEGELVVHTSTQWVEGDRAVLAAALQLPPAKVRVLSPYIGGAFGSKIPTPWATLLAAVAARHLGRPVKTVLTRQQVIATTGGRPETRQQFMLGAQADGRLIALRHHTESQSIVEDGRPDDNEYVEATSRTSRLLYTCPNYEASHEVVRVNKMKPTWMRAPGESPCLWGLESALDELAYELDLDPVELRRRNHAAVDPGSGKPFSSKHLLACYDRGAARFGWARRDPRPGSMREGDMSIGWGMATATYPALTLGSTVRIRLEPREDDVVAIVSTGASDIGQGAYTMMAIVAAEELGLPLDRIEVMLGDSSLPWCGTTGGSALTSSTAPAIKEAAESLKARLQTNGQSVTYAQLVAASGGAVEAEATTQMLMGENDDLVFQSFGAVFVEVRVDRALGRVRVSRVVGVYDIGRALSATATRSQLVGGVVWGISQALFEGIAFDPHKGMPLNADLAGYLVPVNADVPDIDVSWIGEPDLGFNPVGCRGAGEIGITGVSAAIANAVYHATGLRVRDLPISPESLL